MNTTVEVFLAHYGVKGMKWGIRKDRSPRDVTVQNRPGRRVKTAGGHNQPASGDAIKVARYRQQARKSSLDSLSNQELKELVNRMNLEQQFSNLSRQRSVITRGNDTVKRAVGLNNSLNDAYRSTRTNVVKSLMEEHTS